MESLTRIVERYISAKILERHGLILDGWSHASEHFVAVFACYEVDGVMKTPLLCMAPLPNKPDEDLSARGHYELLAGMLSRDYDAEDVNDVKARKSDAEEFIKDGKRKQAQQDVQAKEDAEKVNALLTKDFQRLLEQHETGKERDKK
ncbi:hypothetical protein JG688_00001584 [Phytophthora aleatoria]|uniref:Uncharacterized protein n=1 Tax=Phytophthora aleatoria TaxID=2496075 RepID=A0A8J5J3Z9_9STRA|nr:hypothetical protein JG688_00001584 [Phytophthora aleatoria]